MCEYAVEKCEKPRHVISVSKWKRPTNQPPIHPPSHIYMQASSPTSPVTSSRRRQRMSTKSTDAAVVAALDEAESANTAAAAAAESVPETKQQTQGYYIC